jgi:uncharacterized protein YutE (UPF0331/DUF86 family)
MYFIDRKKIESRLIYFEKLLRYLESIETVPNNEEGVLALERAIHISIEAMLDIGNQMIDGFIMRDPGSYEDIIEILRDESVIEQEEANGYFRWIACRKNLVAEYDQVRIKELWKVFEDVTVPLHIFPYRIRTYLNNELGPVSAFLPNE